MLEAVRVGSSSDFANSERVSYSVAGKEIFVFAFDGAFRAYENVCPHLGGPVCLGRLVPRVEAVVGLEGEIVCERFSDGTVMLNCPWHGFEFDLATGRCLVDDRYALRAFEVVVGADGAISILLDAGD